MEALIFVSDPDRAQFGGNVRPAAIAEIIAHARDIAGIKHGFFANIARALCKLNIHEPEMETVLQYLPDLCENQEQIRKNA